MPFGYEQVDVTLTFSHATDDLDLYLLDTDGMTILRLADSITDNESISYEVTAAGDYYLCVEPVGATGNTYTLRWDSSVPVVASSSATCAPSTATGTAGAAMASFALMIGAALALTRRRVNA